MSAILGIIIKALSDSLLSSLFGFIQSEMHDRGLIQQGREAQHTDDLQQATNEAKAGNQIDEHVEASDSAAVDADLERLRNSASSGH